MKKEFKAWAIESGPTKFTYLYDKIYPCNVALYNTCREARYVLSMIKDNRDFNKAKVTKVKVTIEGEV
jgi:hypothetical protein